MHSEGMKETEKLKRENRTEKVWIEEEFVSCERRKRCIMKNEGE